MQITRLKAIRNKIVTIKDIKRIYKKIYQVLDLIKIRVQKPKNKKDKTKSIKIKLKKMKRKIQVLNS